MGWKLRAPIFLLLHFLRSSWSNGVEALSEELNVPEVQQVHNLEVQGALPADQEVDVAVEDDLPGGFLGRGNLSFRGAGGGEGKGGEDAAMAVDDGWGVLSAAKPSMRLAEMWGASPKAAPAFAASLSMILISELGDKTFFIGALMAMRHKPSVVFGGAMGALGVMTFLSVLVGSALPALLDRVYTHYASVFLFFIFGLKMAYEAYHADPDEGLEGLNEVELELDKKDDASHAKGAYSPGGSPQLPDSGSTVDRSSRKISLEMASAVTSIPLNKTKALFSPMTYQHLEETSKPLGAGDQHSTEPDDIGRRGKKSGGHCTDQEMEQEKQGDKFSAADCESATTFSQHSRLPWWRRPIAQLETAVGLLLKQCLSATFLQAFSLTFLAEWGDRSQIATIALASSKDPFAVAIGALLGHSLCTGLAVVGGKILASRISERVVTAVGAGLFTLFGIMGLVLGV